MLDVDVFCIQWLSFRRVSLALSIENGRKRLKYTSLWKVNFSPGNHEPADRH